jgi:putative transcriptional regulator
VRLMELFEAVDAVLRSSGYRVERINYPDEHRRRSIDVIAVGHGREMLLKVVEDTRDLAVSDVRELNACSKVLRVPGIIVAESDTGDDIDYMVAHERAGTFAVSVEGLRSALENSIYVIKRQKNYYMRIDGEKLRQKRLEKGYSLGDVASRLSVSRRSVYLYEQGETLVSLSVALKLMELFGEDIFKSFDILGGEDLVPEERRQARIYASLSQTSSRSQLARILASMGYRVAATRRIPPDLVAGSDSKRRVIVVVEKRRDYTLERRVEEAVKVADQLQAEVVAVTRRKDIEGYGVDVASSPEEFAELLGEQEE